jgi:hypothetical protein
MKRLLLLVLIVMVAGFYVGWPAWSGYRIHQALKTHDAETLERKIDFASVRVGMRPIVTGEVDKALDRMQRDAGSLSAAFAAAVRKDLAPRIVDAALHTFVTPQNVIKMVQRGGSVRDMVRQSMSEQMGRKSGRAAIAAAAPMPMAGSEPERRTAGLGGIMERLSRPRGSADGIAPSEPAETAPSAPDASPPPVSDPAPAVPPASPPAMSEASTAPPPPAPRRQISFANIKYFSITGPLSFEIGVNRRAEATEPEVVVEMAFRDGDWKVIRVVPRIEP